MIDSTRGNVKTTEMKMTKFYREHFYLLYFNLKIGNNKMWQWSLKEIPTVYFTFFAS